MQRSFVAMAALAVCVAPSARAQSPLSQLVSIQVLDHELVAVDGGGIGPRETLEVDEDLIDHATHGAIGLAITNRRILAVSATSAAWQVARLGPKESGPTRMLLGDLVALTVTSRRILGFEGRTSNLVETRLRPGEDPLGLAIGDNVGIAVTGRRVLGLSTWAGGFFEMPLRVREQVEALDAAADFAILRTDQRLLTFNGRTGVFTEKRLGTGR